MKRILSSLMCATFASYVNASTCSVSDVTIEGQSASSCSGMFSGNVNSLADVNAALSASYTEYVPLTWDGNSFSFDDVYSNIVEIVLKQNTHWAVYKFDLSTLNNADGIWDGTWDTSGIQWDNNSGVAGCQGCGGLSHSVIVGDINEVPLPGTLGLLGLGLLGLGVVRNQRNAP